MAGGRSVLQLRETACPEGGVVRGEDDLRGRAQAAMGLVEPHLKVPPPIKWCYILMFIEPSKMNSFGLF